MLSDISQRGIGYDADLLDVLVVISHESEMSDHRSEAFPSGERWDFDDETREAAG